MNFIKKYISLCLFFYCISNVSVTAIEYNIKNIPDSLTKNAVAVVRNLSIHYEQTDLNNATQKVSKIVTILNENGKSNGNFSIYLDQFSELKSFSGRIVNNEGLELRKIKRKDLNESTLSSQFASDGKSVFFDYRPSVFPYTIEYEYETKLKNGIIAYPIFLPQSQFHVSVQNAEMTMIVPATMNLRIKDTSNVLVEETKEETRNIYKLAIGGLLANEEESYSPSYLEIFPNVQFFPIDFCFDKACGSFKSWHDYGLWVNQLLEGKDVLPPELVAKVQEMVQGIETIDEQVSVIYKYLQDNSRYVSIQLGIGGFQPAPAKEVYANKYGDCKGLSNLMKALLKAANIPSYYCEIYLGNGKDKPIHLYEDYPNVFQTNHVILMVPNKNDSIWLECTSQKTPAGYIHSGIAGHDALVIKENGGVVARIPQYTAEDNKTETILNLKLSETGDIEGTAEFKEYLHQYNYYKEAMTSPERKTQIAYINAYLQFPQIHIENIATKSNDSKLPDCSLSVSFIAPKAITKTGSRLFLPLCPLKKTTYSKLKSDKRKHDLTISYAYTEKDCINYTIPEGYKLEGKNKLFTELSSKFGSFELSLRQEGSSIISNFKVVIYGGNYSKDDYQELKTFYNSIDKLLKQKLVLVKEA